MAFVFGRDVPCRGCHGAGERVEKMSDEEQRARARQIRAEKRRGIYDGERQSPMKRCSECNGRGYVTPEIADARRG